MRTPAVLRGGGRATRTLALLVLAALCFACERERAAREPDPVSMALERLRDFEKSERAATDFARQRPPTAALGADPYRIHPLADGRFVGLLAGAGRLVLLDAEGREQAHIDVTPRSSGLAVDSERREVAVVSERAARILRYRVGESGFEGLEPVALDEARALRDVAYGPGGTLYAADEWTDRLLVVQDANVTSQPLCAGPFELERVEGWLAALCLVDHAAVFRPLDEAGVPRPEGDRRVVHDGPIWSLAARAEGEGLLVALGGVEDHPLDRREGFFGHIDSFAFLYRLRADRAPERIAARNVSELGVVTPKAIAFDGARLLVTGYGGESAAVLDLPGLAGGEPLPLPPGTRELTRAGDGLLLANPLLDAWVHWTPGKTAELHALDPKAIQSDEQGEVRLGETLLHTVLMAPHNSSDGAHSRFTCETCHLEMYTDGRTHHTGRGSVRATTKPLYGLFNNKPHFTRALDPDLTRVAHAEFRVAGKGSGHDPWFALEPGERPWLERVRPVGGTLPPEALRRAVMRYLMANRHRPNPLALRRERFDADERAGAALFRERCASCHAPRLVTDDAGSAIGFERWEELVLSDAGPIVWASEGYRQTGVTPYVHDEGARTSSLRRLYKKRPYFTNGSAKSLAELLAMVRFDGPRFYHAGASPSAEALEREEQRQLLRFLDLL